MSGLFFELRQNDLYNLIVQYISSYKIRNYYSPHTSHLKIQIKMSKVNFFFNGASVYFYILFNNVQKTGLNIEMKISLE